MRLLVGSVPWVARTLRREPVDIGLFIGHQFGKHDSWARSWRDFACDTKSSHALCVAVAEHSSHLCGTAMLTWEMQTQSDAAARRHGVSSEAEEGDERQDCTATTKAVLLSNVAVVLHMRRQGIGRFMVSSLLKETVSHLALAGFIMGSQHLTVVAHVDRENALARAMYTSLGFGAAGGHAKRTAV